MLESQSNRNGRKWVIGARGMKESRDSESEREIDLKERISILLDRLRDTSKAPGVDKEIFRAIESEILGLLDSYLRESLLPVIAKMFGPQVYQKKNDSSLRFTVMMHELFIKILEGRSDLSRFEDGRHLRNWCSQVIRNQMLNHIHQKQQRHENFQAIAPLYDAHKSHFEKRFGSDTYDRALLVIEKWENGDDQRLERYAAILSLHYIMGASWDEVCESLAIGRTTFYDQREAALEQLGNDL